jgi:hypothetical protein
VYEIVDSAKAVLLFADIDLLFGAGEQRDRETSFPLLTTVASRGLLLGQCGSRF